MDIICVPCLYVGIPPLSSTPFSLFFRYFPVISPSSLRYPFVIPPLSLRFSIGDIRVEIRIG